jgi:hypothetical protein
MAFFHPDGADTLSVVIGIQDTLPGYILQSENINQSTPTLQIQDQWGRTAQVIAYDKEFSMSFTAIGPNEAPCSVGDTLSWYNLSGGSMNYIVTNVEKACTFNDTAKWNIQATAYAHAKYSDKSEGELN